MKKRILAAILCFVMVISNVPAMPLFAAGDSHQFVLDTDGIDANGEYLIASGTSGNVNLLTNNNGSVANTTAVVKEGGVIAQFTNDDACTVVFSNTSQGNIKSGSRYLSISGNMWNASLSWATSGTSLQFTKQDNNGAYRISTTSNWSKRYVAYSGGAWSAVSSGTNIYLYKKVPLYKVTYNGNGHTAGNVPAEVVNLQNGYIHTVEAPDSNIKKEIGNDEYLFQCWNTQEDGNGTNYMPGDQLTVTQDVTLYAKWYLRHKYEIAVETNLDNVATDIEDIIGKDRIFFVRKDDGDNYIELNYSKEGVYTTTVTENGTYYVYYKESKESEVYVEAHGHQVIIFNQNGSTTLQYYSVKYMSGDEEVYKEIYHGNEQVLVTTTIPEKQGYVFKGWKYGNSDSLQAGQLITSAITEQQILEAIWEEGNNVTVTVHVDYTSADGGADSASTRDDVVIQLTQVVNGVNEPVGDPVSLNNGSTSYITAQETDDGIQYKYTFYYLSTEYTYNIATAKNGYDIEIEKDASNPNAIKVTYKFKPSNHDLYFRVQMAGDMPKELYPKAVNVKILFWGNNKLDEENTKQWYTITQQKNEGDVIVAPSVVQIGEDGTGEGSYSVWGNWAGTGEAYEYRVEVTSFVMPDGTVVPARSTDCVVYKSDVSGLYSATVGVTGGRVPETAKPNGLPGAYFAKDSDDTEIVQHGDIVVTVSATPFTVKFNANGGKIQNESTYTLNNQYKYPNLNEYVPVALENSKSLFDGWFIDADGNGTLEESERATNNFTLYLMGDVTYVAGWKQPVTLSGNISVKGNYDLGENQESVWERDRATEVAVVLQKKTGNAYNDIASVICKIEYDEQTKDGEANYQFAVPADGSDYRIQILELNYIATYDRDEDNTFTSNENEVNVMLESRTVNVEMSFEPEGYEERLIIDASKINSTYRPSYIEAKILYRNLGTNEVFNIISQHKSKALQVAMETNGIGFTSEVVWKWHTDGKLYEYKSGEFKLFGSVEGVYTPEGTPYSPETSPYTIYFGPNAWWDNSMNDQSNELQATLIPKTYTITFDMGAGEETIYGMDEYVTDNKNGKMTYSYQHTWSFSDYLTALPYRAGYVFEGWECADEDKPSVVIDNITGGEIIIGAAVSKDITLTATWSKIETTNNTGYYAVRHLELNTDKVLHKAEVYPNIPFNTSVSVLEHTKELTGYKYAGYKVGEKYVEAGNETNFVVKKGDNMPLITIYYLPDGSDGYTEQVESNLHISKDALLQPDGTYTITMDMYTKDNPITTQILQNTPLDIVLVLDQSGSIYKNDFLDELQSAVSNFVTLIAEHGRQNEVDHRIAMVGYASDEDMGVTDDSYPYAGGEKQTDWVNTGVFDSNGDFHNYPTTGFNYTKTNDKPEPDGTYYAYSDGEYQLLLHHDTYYHLLTEEEARTEQLKGSKIYGYVDGGFVELERNASGLWLYEGKQQLYSAKEFFTYHEDVWTHRKGIEKRQIHAYGTGNAYVCVDGHGDLYKREDTEGSNPQLNVYKDALVPVSIGANGAGGVNPGLQTSVSHLGANGGTCVEYGIEMANKVFAANPIATGDNRVRIMVMFTDGVPGQYNFDTNAANRAIAKAYDTKNTYNAYSYTIGLYQSNGVTGTSEESIYMHAVSSNYKEAKTMDDVFERSGYTVAKSKNINDGGTYCVRVSNTYYQLRYGSHTPSGSSAKVGWYYVQSSGWPVTISTNRTATTSTSGKISNTTIYIKEGSYTTASGTGHYSTTESEGDLKQYFSDVVQSITTKITTEIILHSDTIMRDIMGQGFELTMDTVITAYTQNGTYDPQTKGITWEDSKTQIAQLLLKDGTVSKEEATITYTNENKESVSKVVPYIQVYNWDATNTTNPDAPNYAPHTVDITGYDFTNGYISENHTSGFKLIVTITRVEAQDDVEWGRSTKTNYETSGIWLPADAKGERQLLLPFEQPTTIFTERSYVLDYAKEFELAGWYYNQVEKQEKGKTIGSEGTAIHLDPTVLDKEPTKDGMNGFVTTNPTVSTGKELTYGNAHLNDKIVRYTPTSMKWDHPEQFYVFGQTEDSIIRKQDANRDGYLWTRVNVIPANNVYYEDTFETSISDTENGFEGFKYTGDWKVEGETDNNTETPEHLEEPPYGDVHGWIDSMNDDTKHSDGTAHMAGYDQTRGAQVSFTFVGTGVDIYTRTNDKSGMVLAMLKGTTIKDNATVSKSVVMDNLAMSGDYYNIPTISFSDLQYGTYTVTLVVSAASEAATGSKRYEYYLDGIRVYNPLGGDRTADHLNDRYNSIIKDAYAEEQNAIFKLVRDILLVDYNSLNSGAHDKGDPGAVFIDWIRGQENGVDTKTYDIGEYKDLGPKNEVYLAQGQSIVLKVDPQYTYYVGMKSLNGKTVYANVSGVDNIDNPSIMEIKHSIDQAYKIKPRNGYIVIGNNLLDTEGQEEDAILSITKLCVTSLYEPAKEYIQPITATESIETVTDMVMFMRRPTPTPDPEPLPEEPELPEIPEAPEVPETEDGESEKTPENTLETTPSATIKPSQTVVSNTKKEPITSNQEEKQESLEKTEQADDSELKQEEAKNEETTDVEEPTEEESEKLGFLARIAQFFKNLFEKIGQWFENLLGSK